MIAGSMKPCIVIVLDTLFKQSSQAKGTKGPSLRERFRTHKVFTKDQCFYLNYHKFSIKSYVLDVY